MSRTEEFWGSRSLEHLFPGNTPLTPAPWPQASVSKTHRYFNPRLVDEALSKPDVETVKVDPRGLHATQPDVTRAGVEHYLSGREGLYADAHQAGNKHPVVFHDEMRDRDVLLSGHHRATAALLRGEQFDAVPVSGQPATHAEAADYQREVTARSREQRQRAANEAMMARIAAAKGAKQ